MATQTLITDDLDQSPGATTVRVSVDGEAWDVDLSPTNHSALTDALSRYRDAGRPVAKRTAGTTNSEASACRAWCLSNGVQVSPTGKISEASWSAYRSRPGAAV